MPNRQQRIALFFKKKILFIFGEREREEEEKGRNIDQLPLASPQLGTWPTTQTYALTGNRTSDRSVCGMTHIPVSHASQGENCSFLILGSCDLLFSCSLFSLVFYCFSLEV